MPSKRTVSLPYTSTGLFYANDQICSPSKSPKKTNYIAISIPNASPECSYLTARPMQIDSQYFVPHSSPLTDRFVVVRTSKLAPHTRASTSRYRSGTDGSDVTGGSCDTLAVRGTHSCGPLVAPTTTDGSCDRNNSWGPQTAAGGHRRQLGATDGS